MKKSKLIILKNFQPINITTDNNVLFVKYFKIKKSLVFRIIEHINNMLHKTIFIAV